MTDRGLPYMPALDGLRALAVLGVMLFHFNVSWAKGGYFGVDAFFVLSGFLITSLLLQERRASGRIDLKSFWVRRARRLLPALALVLAAVALYASRYASPVELHQLRTDGLATIFYVANWNQVFSHVSYFQQFAAPSLLHHTWSLAIEEQFYVLWPLVVFFALRRGRLGRRGLIGLTAGLAASALLMAILYHPGHDPSRVYYGTDTHAQSLLIGAVLAMLLIERPIALKRPHRLALHGGAIVAVIGLAFIWTLTDYTSDYQYRGGFALAAILVCVVVTSVTRAGDPGPVGWILSRAPLRAIGIISYGVYLWHYPVYVFVNEDRTNLDGAPLVFVRIAATFAIATASFFVIERPVRFGALRGWQGRVVTPVAGAALASLLMVSTAGAIPTELQSISSKQVAPPPAVRPQAAGAAQPLRFMLVGDSVAASLQTGLKAEAAKRGQLFWGAAVPGCGIATDAGDRWVGSWIGPDPNCLPGWRTRWPQQVKQFHPNVVVVLLGAQDTFDRRINGAVTKFDTTAGTALAKKDLTDTVTTLTKTSAHVVFLTTPYYVQGWPMKIDAPRSLFNATWINRWNAIQRDVVQHSGGRASILDLNKLIDPNGVWTDTVNGIKVRLFDKMHLSKDGATFVGKWLTPKLPRYLPTLIGRHAA